MNDRPEYMYVNRFSKLELNLGKIQAFRSIDDVKALDVSYVGISPDEWAAAVDKEVNRSYRQRQLEQAEQLGASIPRILANIAGDAFGERKGGKAQ